MSPASTNMGTWPATPRLTAAMPSQKARGRGMPTPAPQPVAGLGSLIDSAAPRARGLVQPAVDRRPVEPAVVAQLGVPIDRIGRSSRAGVEQSIRLPPGRVQADRVRIDRPSLRRVGKDLDAHPEDLAGQVLEVRKI